MNKIRVIDLLNKIANGEEVPKKIKYINSIWEYNKVTKDYIHNDIWLFYGMNAIGLTEREVEIIEEDKEIEKFKIYDNSIDWCCNERAITNTEKDIMDKTNEIIDYLMENNK